MKAIKNPVIIFCLTGSNDLYLSSIFLFFNNLFKKVLYNNSFLFGDIDFILLVLII